MPHSLAIRGGHDDCVVAHRPADAGWVRSRSPARPDRPNRQRSGDRWGRWSIPRDYGELADRRLAVRLKASDRHDALAGGCVSAAWDTPLIGISVRPDS